mmetsp:Transcript_48696/g.90348  ORF Transcript_48696/g.90348 Transcript_48696/m.90348 type:complete len:1039 (-) Transcript_48696:398-3514(-)
MDPPETDSERDERKSRDDVRLDSPWRNGAAARVRRRRDPPSYFYPTAWESSSNEASSGSFVAASIVTHAVGREESSGESTATAMRSTEARSVTLVADQIVNSSVGVEDSSGDSMATVVRSVELRRVAWADECVGKKAETVGVAETVAVSIPQGFSVEPSIVNGNMNEPENLERRHGTNREVGRVRDGARAVPVDDGNPERYAIARINNTLNFTQEGRMGPLRGPELAGHYLPANGALGSVVIDDGVLEYSGVANDGSVELAFAGGLQSLPPIDMFPHNNNATVASVEMGVAGNNNEWFGTAVEDERTLISPVATSEDGWRDGNRDESTLATAGSRDGVIANSSDPMFARNIEPTSLQPFSTIVPPSGDRNGNMHHQFLEGSLSAVDAGATFEGSFERNEEKRRKVRRCMAVMCAVVMIVGIAAAVAVPLSSRGCPPCETIQAENSGMNDNIFDTTTVSAASTNETGPTMSPTESTEPSISPIPSTPPTAEPTSAPVTGRFRRIKTTLAGVVASAGSLENKSSPQFRALEWIAFEDGANVPPENTLWLVQRYALAVIYFSTGGTNAWQNWTRFLSDDNECLWNYQGERWYYIEVGFFCSDTTGAVTRIELTNLNAAGSLPEEISALRSLESLNMKNTNLTGTLPSGLGALVNLRDLDLSGNRLRGRLPLAIGNLSALRRMDLRDNMLNGPLPTEIGDMSSLRSLTLESNEFVGTLPTEVAKLTQLSDLWLSDNAIRDDMATIVSILRNLNDLYHLDLRSNQIYGTIPNAIRRMQPLRHLDLANNSISGTIPRRIGQLSQLNQLHLAENQLEGSIPESLGKSVNLGSLSLDGNFLTGALPLSMENIELYELSMTQNLLSGTFPSWLPRVTSLVVLYLGSNMFNGSLPEDLFDIPYLEEVSVESNLLTGFLPIEGNSDYLRVLNLHSNNMTGNIPSWICERANIKIADFGKNNFSGELPECFGELKDLSYFHIARTGITGSIDFMCGTNVTSLIADCGTPAPEVECTCCSSCCVDGQADRQCDFDVSSVTLGKSNGLFTGT